MKAHKVAWVAWGSAAVSSYLTRWEIGIELADGTFMLETPMVLWGTLLALIVPLGIWSWIRILADEVDSHLSEPLRKERRP